MGAENRKQSKVAQVQVVRTVERGGERQATPGLTAMTRSSDLMLREGWGKTTEIV